ncbi:MAG: OsmC family protein [Caldilineaceae bacterium]
MAKLDPYLQRKASILAERRAQLRDNPRAGIVQLKATSHVAGNTGVRPVKMGDYIVISDSAPGLAGHSLGPSSPEMLLGALASCLIHTYLLQATLLEIPLDHVEVVIEGALDMAPVVGLPHDGPIKLGGLSYTPTVTSPADDAAIERLHSAVEQTCAVLNTLRSPMEVVRKD